MSKNSMVWGVVRAILAAGAGALATKGWLDTSSVEPLIGAIMLVITVGWSAWQKIED